MKEEGRKCVCSVFVRPMRMSVASMGCVVWEACMRRQSLSRFKARAVSRRRAFRPLLQGAGGVVMGEGRGQVGAGGC